MRTFYDRFLECVERWPNNVALEIQRPEGVESYTYAELRRMAESIARWITGNGFEPGSRCAILADNHPRWVATYLGSIAAGCAAVPLDTTLHADQVIKLVEDSGSSLLFSDVKHIPIAREAMRKLPVRIVLTDPALDDGFVGTVREFSGVGRGMLVSPGKHRVKICYPARELRSRRT